VTEPPPLLYCGEFAGAWKPPWSLDELLPESADEPPSLEPDELELEPEELEPDELDPVDVDPLLLPVTAAWLVPGSTTATAPAASTLATDTATVVVFSRRRPSSRSATACATRRACAARSVCFSQLFTLLSVTRTSVGAVGELSQNILSAQLPQNVLSAQVRDLEGLPGRAELPVFSNAQRRLHRCLRRRVRHWRVPRGA
jgi:hypothetical protein